MRRLMFYQLILLVFLVAAFPTEARSPAQSLMAVIESGGTSVNVSTGALLPLHMLFRFQPQRDGTFDRVDIQMLGLDLAGPVVGRIEMLDVRTVQLSLVSKVLGLTLDSWITMDRDGGYKLKVVVGSLNENVNMNLTLDAEPVEPAGKQAAPSRECFSVTATKLSEDCEPVTLAGIKGAE